MEPTSFWRMVFDYLALNWLLSFILVLIGLSGIGLIIYGITVWT